MAAHQPPLKRAMAAAGIKSIHELATEADVSRATIYNIRLGKHDASLEVLEKVAAALSRNGATVTTAEMVDIAESYRKRVAS
jgi:DNA-binding XRE family transcriptional regulator